MRKEEAFIRMCHAKRQLWEAKKRHETEARRKYVKTHGMKRKYDKFDNKAWFTVTPEWRKLLLAENRVGLQACFDKYDFYGVD